MDLDLASQAGLGLGLGLDCNGLGLRLGLAPCRTCYKSAYTCIPLSSTIKNAPYFDHRTHNALICDSKFHPQPSQNKTFLSLICLKILFSKFCFKPISFPISCATKLESVIFCRNADSKFDKTASKKFIFTFFLEVCDYFQCFGRLNLLKIFYNRVSFATRRALKAENVEIVTIIQYCFYFLVRPFTTPKVRRLGTFKKIIVS